MLLSPSCTPSSLHLCPKPPTSCPSLNRGTRVTAWLGTAPPQVLQSPSACAWQLLPGRDGGVLAGNSLWVSTRACCACVNIADRQTDAHIPTHAFVSWTDTCPPPHWTPSRHSPALRTAIRCHKVLHFQHVSFISQEHSHVPVSLISVPSRKKLEGACYYRVSKDNRTWVLRDGAHLCSHAHSCSHAHPTSARCREYSGPLEGPDNLSHHTG